MRREHITHRERSGEERGDERGDSMHGARREWGEGTGRRYKMRRKILGDTNKMGRKIN